MARTPAIERDTNAFRLTLNIRSLCLTNDQFLHLCGDNDLRIELTADGELIIMSGTNGETGQRNARITMRLGIWTERDGTGVSFSDAIFALPNGAKRVPDGAWIPKSKWNRLTKEEKWHIPKMCPDFVIELRSPSDRLADVEEKMEEYIANGALLGWLLDPIENHAAVYRPGQPPQRINQPTILSGESVLPGFEFDFKEIL